MASPSSTSATSAASASGSSRSRSAGWSRIGERGSIWGIRFTVWCYRRFGRRLSLPLVFAVVTYFFLTDARGRRASRAYLHRIHADPRGRASLPRPPGLRECFRHYRTFALCIVDRLAIWFGREGELEFSTHGLDYVDQLAEKGRGALILGSHLGSFDALRLLAKRAGSVVNVLMFTANAQRINQVFREVAPEIEARVISVDPSSVHSVFTIRERLRRGEHVAILADRIEVGDRDRALGVPLLGGVAELPQAPILLAGLLGCPLVSAVALRDGPGRYQVHVDVLAERVRLPRQGREQAVAELLTSYARHLERYCLLRPYQWFNFFDYWRDEAPAVAARQRAPAASA
jgi:predicted LPLAT superfamily acyltransferase